jgi:hypothetical protein
MKDRYEDLIHAIVWYASRRGEKLTTLRLVKFLYLADLYHARTSKGETLTGWPWSFVYFGPWCKEVNEAIETTAKNGLILAQEYPSKYDDEKDYRLFWVDDTDDEPKIIESLPTYVWSKLQWAIQKWADDSSGLLDYVYFETEPMLETKPGALLDFRQSHMPVVAKKFELKKLPIAKLDEARRTVGRLKEKYKQSLDARPSQGPADTAYQEFVSKLEEEDLETGLQGTAELGDLESGRKS